MWQGWRCYCRRHGKNAVGICVPIKIIGCLCLSEPEIPVRNKFILRQVPEIQVFFTQEFVPNVIHGFIFWAIARTMSVDDTTLALVLFGLASLASVIAGIAMWFWKRWGIHLYVIASLVLGGVVLLKTVSMFMMFGVMLPMIIVIFIFKPAYKHFK